MITDTIARVTTQNKPKPKATRTKWDKVWKQVLKIYFPAFMELFFPEIAEKFDWTQPLEFLDKEMESIRERANIGRRTADLLIKAYRKDRRVWHILVHLEIQGKKQDIFPQRMFIYRIRAWEMYKLPVLSLAILTDDNLRWRPDRYEDMCDDFGVQFKYGVVKLADYKNRRDELEKSNNPFALIILAHFDAKRTHKKDQERLYARTALTRALYKRGLSGEEIGVLMEMLEHWMRLPEPLVVEYDAVVAEIEGRADMGMSYATRIEQKGVDKGIQQGLQQGIQQGLQQGLQQGEATLLIRQLKHRFGDVPVPYLAKIQHASDALLLYWGEKLLDAQSIEEIFS